MPLPNPQYGIIAGGQGGGAGPSGINTEAAGTRPVAVSSDSGKPTYGASGNTLTLYSTAAAVLFEIQGSATKTVRIKRISLWGQLTAPATKFFTEVQLIRATSVAATGIPVVAALVPFDKNDPAATAVVNSYAGAATLGTGPLVINAKPVALTAPAAGAVGPIESVWHFSTRQDKALILRGTADVIQVYNTILTLGTGTFGFAVQFEEDNS